MSQDDKSRVAAAIEAHTRWIIRVRAAVNSGASEFEPAAVRLDHACEFGRWLYGESSAKIRGSSLYEEIRSLHASFHEQAASILELALEGNSAKALAAMDADSPFNQKSLALIGALRRLERRT